MFDLTYDKDFCTVLGEVFAKDPFIQLKFKPAETCVPHACRGCAETKAMEEVKKYHSFFPGISRVIYSLKTEDTVRKEDGTKETKRLENPILTTIVFWDDNVKTVVKNSANDTVTTETVDGVEVASRASKEVGFVMAFFKRYLSDAEGKQHVSMCTALKRVVDNAHDQVLEEKRASAAKLKAKKEHEAKKTAAAAKPKRPTLAEAMDQLGQVIRDVAELKGQATPTRARDEKGRFI